MLEISQEEIVSKLTADNIWWQDTDKIPYGNFSKRDYFNKFLSLVQLKEINRALIMMGPRRVGKTVILYQSIAALIEESKVPPKNILYISLDTPTYLGLSLEKIFRLFTDHHGLSTEEPLFIYFDEIQYLKDWEVHLKNLVDTYRTCKFIASGSAAAALRMKSHESGAGRFTDFMLPPLTFAEYLRFMDIEDQLIIKDIDDPRKDKTTNIDGLNAAFIDYLNYGGYPEVVANPLIRDNMAQYVRSDIVDKVLLRDLPTLYGIRDISELNLLFRTLAYNTGNEVSLNELSKTSGVAKQTLNKYLEYLEAAFLISKVKRIDQEGKRFKREMNFKVYLTNPSIRSSLFKPLSDEDEGVGHLVETGIFSQWFHSQEMDKIRYARWKNGEVDIVGMNETTEKPHWAYEVKWTDRCFENPKKLKSLLSFAKKNHKQQLSLGATTKTKEGTTTVGGFNINHFPASLHCYQIARRVTKDKII